MDEPVETEVELEEDDQTFTEMITDKLSAVPAFFGYGSSVEAVSPLEDPYLVVYFPELLDEEYPDVPLYRAFGNYADAKHYFEWQKIIGQEHAAIYDAELSRLEQGVDDDPTFGYFLFDRFVQRELPEDAWTIYGIDPDAPYLVGLWYGRAPYDEPVGHILAEVDEARMELEGTEGPAFIYNIHGEQIALKGKLNKMQQAAVEEYAIDALERFVVVN